MMTLNIQNKQKKTISDLKTGDLFVTNPYNCNKELFVKLPPKWETDDDDMGELLYNCFNLTSKQFEIITDSMTIYSVVNIEFNVTIDD